MRGVEDAPRSRWLECEWRGLPGGRASTGPEPWRPTLCEEGAESAPQVTLAAPQTAWTLRRQSHRCSSPRRPTPSPPLDSFGCRWVRPGWENANAFPLSTPAVHTHTRANSGSPCLSQLNPQPPPNRPRQVPEISRLQWHPLEYSLYPLAPKAGTNLNSNAGPDSNSGAAMLIHAKAYDRWTSRLVRLVAARGPEVVLRAEGPYADAPLWAQRAGDDATVILAGGLAGGWVGALYRGAL